MLVRSLGGTRSCRFDAARVPGALQARELGLATNAGIFNHPQAYSEHDRHALENARSGRIVGEMSFSPNVALARAEVLLYRTRFCGYCVGAAQFLASKGAQVREIDVTGDDACRRWLVETTGMRTVPQVFVNGRPLGGFTDLLKLERSGKLDALLSEPPPVDRKRGPCEPPAAAH